jgi:ankyrin repeat protein
MNKEIEKAVTNLYKAINLGDIGITRRMIDELSNLAGDLGSFIESEYYLTKDFGFGTTFLEFAVQKQHIGIMNMLISSGMDVNTLGGSSSPLMETIIINHTKIATILICNGADVEFKDEDDITPLMVASSSGNLELVKLLITHGADPSALDVYEKTAIQCAAEEGYQEIVEYLCNYVSEEDTKAAILECKDGVGYKARKKRQRLNSSNIISLLYHAVASRNTIEIESALAKKDYKHFTYEEYDEHTKRLLTPIDLAVKSNDINILNLLIDNFTIAQDMQNFDFPDSHKFPYIVRAMFLAAALSRQDIFDFLWDFLMSKKFINQDIKDMALCNACNNSKSLEIIQKVIESGANINFLADEGTPLMVASEKGDIDVVIKLVELGATVDYKDLEYEVDSAIRLAVDNENWNIVEYLLPLVKDRTDKQYAKRRLSRIKSDA